ncbi:conserved protein of unknown function [Tenacibaculum sp. 190130A14a]|uniref:Uncharacterized protein n=1 Tax=Tenacibaculum polynesiense TaxID=3137857 RepID=A0ABM9P9B3_9FLAO
MGKTLIPSTATKENTTSPSSDFHFGTDAKGNQILVAKPLSAYMNPIGYDPNRMPYDLTIVVGIDSGYTGTPSLYYDDSESAFIVEFNYEHTEIPSNLYKWTISVQNGDGRILTGTKHPSVHLYDSINTSIHIMVNGDGTETSKGTEVSFSKPPEEEIKNK